MGEWGDGVLGDWETQSVMHTMEKKDYGIAAKVGASLLALFSVLIALEVVCRLWADRRGQLRLAREADKARRASIWQLSPQCPGTRTRGQGDPGVPCGGWDRSGMGGGVME